MLSTTPHAGDRTNTGHTKQDTQRRRMTISKDAPSTWHLQMRVSTLILSLSTCFWRHLSSQPLPVMLMQNSPRICRCCSVSSSWDSPPEVIQMLKHLGLLSPFLSMLLKAGVLSPTQGCLKHSATSLIRSSHSRHAYAVMFQACERAGVCTDGCNFVSDFRLSPTGTQATGEVTASRNEIWVWI